MVYIFFFFAFYLLINFYLSGQKKIILLILSGFVCALAFISKIQIIFFILFLILLIPFMKKIFSVKNRRTISKKPFLSFLIIIYLSILSLYILIEYFVIYQHSLHIGKAKIDLYVYIAFNLFYFFYLKQFSKDSFELKENISNYLIFFFGIISIFAILILLNFFEIAKVNQYIYYKFLNPIEILNRRSINLDYKYLLFEFLNIKTFLRPGYFFLLFLIFFGTLYLKNIFNLNKFYIINTIGLFLLYSFSHNLRYFEIYEIYTYSSLIIFIILICNINYTHFRNFFLAILIIYNLNNTFINNNFKKNFNIPKPMSDLNCDELDKSILYHYRDWTMRLDKEFYKKACESYSKN